MLTKVKTFSWECKSGKTSLTKSWSSSLCFYLSLSKNAGKITDTIVISDYPVTLLIHYWYPEASNLRYLSFVPLVFHPTRNKIDITVVPTVSPEHKKSPPPFTLSATISFQPCIEGNFMQFYNINNHFLKPVIMVKTRTQPPQHSRDKKMIHFQWIH